MHLRVINNATIIIIRRTKTSSAMSFLYFVCLVIATAAASPITDTNIFTKSNAFFSTKFYDAVSNDSGNLLISPLSLNYALTVLSLGAGGNTLKELKTALNQLDDKNCILSSYRTFTNSLKGDKNLTVANKIYVDNKFQIKETFKNDVISNFDAGIDSVDFAGNPENSRTVINNYVKDKTNNLIPELFEKDTITQDTVSAIVNAVYFKSTWLKPFDKELTHKQTFYGLQQEYKVDMMVVTGDFNFNIDSELNAKLIELPYTGDYSFLAILPKDKKGITEVEHKIRQKTSNSNLSPFTEMFKHNTKQRVHVYLPKFKFEQTHNLQETLEKMNIKEIFTTSANFENLSSKPLVISTAVQKTYISIDEESTEAAAATGFGIKLTSMNVTPKQEFKADHPFIYLIVHKPTQTVLFIGRYSHSA